MIRPAQAHGLQPVGLAPPPFPGGYREASIELAGRTLSYLRPADPDRLLDDPATIAACEADGDAPYWPLLWPPAETMARSVAAADLPPETTVFEVGCGIGLVGLAAAARGWRTTVSDIRPEAVALAASNAALNGLAVEPLTLDWRTPPDRTFDLILGCEVIYDAALHAALLGLLTRTLNPDGSAWLADFGRMHAPLFARRAAAAGFAATLVDEYDQLLPTFRTAAYQLLKLRRR